MKPYKLLLAGLACIVCGLLLYDVWAFSQYALQYIPRAHAEGPRIQISDTLSEIPLPRLQPAALRPAPTAAAADPTRAGAPQPAAPAARSTPVHTSIYRVKPGDTLFLIALNYGVTIDELVRVNQITNPDSIYPGQELIIPGGGMLLPTRAVVTRTPAKAATRVPSAPLPPAPGQVNGVPLAQFITLPVPVKQNIRKLYVQGQARGNNPHAFSKIGDSNMENPYFLTSFDQGPYNLGDYRYLEPAIEHFAGSFGRISQAVRKGFHSWSVLDAELADKTACWPTETPLDCELRWHHPSFVLIRLGTNDAGHPQLLQESLQTIVERCVRQGIVPIVGTKADRAEGPEDTNNKILRQVAADSHIPLWDFDRVAETLPNRGLSEDNVHLTIFYPLNYALPEAFQHGHSVDDLVALMALDQVWRAATQTP